MPNFFIKILP